MDDDLSYERDLVRRMRTEGAEAAYQAALSVCRDPEATAQSRATASSVILRAAGYFNARDDGGSGKQPHEMTADEIQEAIKRLGAAAKGRTPGIFD